MRGILRVFHHAHHKNKLQQKRNVTHTQLLSLLSNFLNFLFDVLLGQNNKKGEVVTNHPSLVLEHTHTHINTCLNAV